VLVDDRPEWREEEFGRLVSGNRKPKSARSLPEAGFQIIAGVEIVVVVAS